MVVRRRAPGSFWMALLGVPLLALFYDFANDQTLLAKLGEIIYPGDVEGFEVRDVIWASVYVVVGSVAVVWGLWELLAPRKVLVVDERGLLIQLRGILHRSSLVYWAQIEQAELVTYMFDGQSSDGLSLTLSDHATLPRHPWGAQWLDDHTLVIDCGAWDKPLPPIVTAINTKIGGHQPTESWT